MTPLKLDAEGGFSQRPGLKAALARDPHGFAVRLGVNADRPGLPGSGIGGRVQFSAGPFDLAGPLTPTLSSADAPVIRIGGPLEVTFHDERPDLRAGRAVDAALVVGSPGIGPGAFAMLEFDGCIPATVNPVLELTPPGSPMSRERIELKQRC